MSPWAYVALAGVGALRLAELAWSTHTRRRLVSAGARAVRPDGFAGLLAVHAVWFAAAAAEATWAPWASTGWWTVAGLALFAAGMGLRYWSMAALGRRWNVRVFVLDAPLVRAGPYRFLRHPIYAGVVLELFGLPVAFGLWATAVVVLPLHLAALRHRIAIEASALAR